MSDKRVEHRGFVVFEQIATETDSGLEMSFAQLLRQTLEQSDFITTEPISDDKMQIFEVYEEAEA